LAGLRPTFGRVSRYGVMALSWTQDRLGPLCRYSEDCAVVMSVIAKPDDRDLSVSDIPFNWNAHLDIKKLRVGYLREAFDEVKDPAAKSRDQKTVEVLQGLGVKLVDVKIPDWTLDTSSINVESGAFFDELIRTGHDHEMTNPGRGTGFRTARLMSAVDYIQNQRARAMMMEKLAEATANVDVYLCPANAGGPPAGAAGRGGRGAGAPDAAARDRQRRSPIQRHFAMANLAGYPAVAMVNGFEESGSPTSITFYARPFGEAELLALGKAYQDAAGFLSKRPKIA
jgi:Asp-tRNA(Asn)/Glu-tRNA(Gln) amidotransferase A subunit family amidase